MAYDEALAARVKEILSARSDIAERKMFGGLAFMLAGNMCCCVTDRGLMVRVGPEGYEEALALPHAGV
ncbi:MAG: TfoX/Sxy family protein, partial [Rhodospirillaceae bacterium]|nr:TfoX/Sxy family protein [Rhodospirillaceae bacterium]